MIKRTTLVLLLASLVSASSSLAQNGPTPPPARSFKLGDPTATKPKPALPVPPAENVRMVWRRGSNIEVCPKTGKCIRRPLPKSAGKPISVIRAPFIRKELAPISILVVSNKRYSLCYITSLKPDAVNVCRQIKAPVIKGGSISIKEHPGFGTVMGLTFDPKVAKTMTREQKHRALARLAKGIVEAQKAITKVAKGRQSVDRFTRPMMIDNGGGGGSCDWDGNCSGGAGGSDAGGGIGDWWPDQPSDGGDDNGSGSSDEPNGSDDGGGYPEDNPDTGGGSGNGAGHDQVLPIPIIPGLPVPTPNGSGGTTICIGLPDGGGYCNITAANPNTHDPETGQTLPTSPVNEPRPTPIPEQERPWSWCDLWAFSWMCGENPAPEHPPLEVIPSPYIPPAPEPITRYKEGYEEAIQQCQKSYDVDMEICGSRYAMLGGPSYDDMLQNGVRLTPGERKEHKKAKTDFGVCSAQSADDMAKCQSTASDNFRQ